MVLMEGQIAACRTVLESESEESSEGRGGRMLALIIFNNRLESGLWISLL